MNARLIARCTGPRPFDGACGFLRRFGWCGHFVMVCREFSTSAPLARNARLIARCTGPRPFDGACGFLRRFGWCGHFVMVCLQPPPRADLEVGHPRRSWPTERGWPCWQPSKMFNNNNMFKPLTLGRWPTLSLRVERGHLRQLPEPLAVNFA